jgi:hypothetical protein
MIPSKSIHHTGYCALADAKPSCNGTLRKRGVKTPHFINDCIVDLLKESFRKGESSCGSASLSAELDFLGNLSSSSDKGLAASLARNRRSGNIVLHNRSSRLKWRREH